MASITNPGGDVKPPIEPLGAPVDLAAHSRAAVAKFRARKPLLMTSAWLLDQLPGLIHLDEARQIVGFTLDREAVGAELSVFEQLLLTQYRRSFLRCVGEAVCR